MTEFASFHDLKGASVFITGGGSGIGAALTEGFLHQGAKVAFVQRSDAGEFVEAMAHRHGKTPIFLPCDITDVDALRSAMTEAASAWPVIIRLTPEARNKVAPTMSSGFRCSCRHCLPRWAVRSSGVAQRASWRSVSTQPGMSAFTRILSGPNSRARERVRPVIAALELA